MFEVRAILLGRMGKHQAALEIYVYRLNNFAKAEEYVPTLGYILGSYVHQALQIGQSGSA